MDFRQEWPTFSSHFLKEKEHALENKYRKQKDFVPTLLLPHTYAIKTCLRFLSVIRRHPPARPAICLRKNKTSSVKISTRGFLREDRPKDLVGLLQVCWPVWQIYLSTLPCFLVINIALILLFPYQHCSDLAFSLSTLLWPRFSYQHCSSLAF